MIKKIQRLQCSPAGFCFLLIALMMYGKGISKDTGNHFPFHFPKSFVNLRPTESNVALVSGLVSGQAADCFGTSNGSISITSPTGGSGVYAYSINGGTTWATTSIFTNLPAATYKVMIRDASNTQNVATLYDEYMLSEPSKMSASVVATQVTQCGGNQNGAIKINGASGGSENFLYSINGGTTWKTTATFTNVSAGVYAVMISDAFTPTCKVTLNGNLVITEPVKMNATVSSTNVTVCNGNLNGLVSVTSPSGGSGNYQFSIDGGMTWPGSGSSYNFSGLGAGSYNVQMRDANNVSCISILNSSIKITQPSVLSASLAVANVTGSNGNSDGSISISAAVGGSGNYNYTFDGGITWTGSGNSYIFSGLLAGSYNVAMRDASNPTCVQTLNSSLTITQPLSLNATVVASNISQCHGNLNGSIFINAAQGGSGTYQYSKDGGLTWTNTSSFSSLSAGTYKVMMRDAASPAIIVTLQPALVLTEPMALSASVSGTDATCSNSDGKISITNVAGGSGIYEYNYNETGPWSSSSQAAGLTPGSYEVRIRDAANTTCIAQLPTVTIAAPQPILVKSLDIMAACVNENTGAVTTEIQGGSGPYSYLWTGAAFTSSQPNPTGMAAGAYTLRIEDAKGCVNTSTVGVPEKSCSSIHMGNISGLLCNDSTISIAYTMDMPFNDGNKIKVLISDSLGNFANGVFIDSAYGTQSGNISVAVKDILPGKKYMIRLATTSPAQLSQASDHAIEIGSKPSLATISGPAYVCLGFNQESFYVQGASYAATFTWYDYQHKVISNTGTGSLNMEITETVQNHVEVVASNQCGVGKRAVYDYEVLPLPVFPLIAVQGITLTAAPAVNYQWFLNDELIAGATSQTLQALKSGAYRVNINTDICTSQDSAFFQGITWDQDNNLLVVPQLVQATYEWYYNNVLIAGAGKSALAPIATGTYKAVITFDNSNLRTAETMQAVYEIYYDATVTAVKDVEEHDVAIFPNPGNGLFHTSASFGGQQIQVTLFTLTGQEVANQLILGDSGNGVLDFTNVEKGVYFIKLTGNGQVVTKKVMIDRDSR